MTPTCGPSGSKPFRFMDLPPEVRLMVYQELLCTIDPNVTWSPKEDLHRILDQKEDAEGFNILSHNIETSILRTCRTIYSEAFDVMAKTNQFIRFTTKNVVTAKYIQQDQVPLVSINSERIARFNGYIMHMTIEAPRVRTRRSTGDQISEWMLTRSALTSLCRSLPYFSQSGPSIRATVNIGDCIWNGRSNTFSWANFCTRRRIEMLLGPIETYVRGIKHLAIETPELQPSRQTSAVFCHVKWKYPWSDFTTFKNYIRPRYDKACARKRKHNYAGASAILTELMSRCPDPFALEENDGSWNFDARCLGEIHTQNAMCYLGAIRREVTRASLPLTWAKQLFSYFLHNAFEAIMVLQMIRNKSGHDKRMIHDVYLLILVGSRVQQRNPIKDNAESQKEFHAIAYDFWEAHLKEPRNSDYLQSFGVYVKPKIARGRIPVGTDDAVREWFSEKMFDSVHHKMFWKPSKDEVDLVSSPVRIIFEYWSVA